MGKNKKRRGGIGKVTAQYSPAGELVAVCESANEASRVTGTNEPCISLCCRGLRANANGYMWIYSDNPPKDIRVKKFTKGRPVMQLTINGEMVEVYGSARIAADAVGVAYSSIMEVANGGRCKTAGGFVWKRLAMPA